MYVLIPLSDVYFSQAAHPSAPVSLRVACLAGPSEAFISPPGPLGDPWVVKDEKVAPDGAESWMSNHLLASVIHYS